MRDLRGDLSRLAEMRRIKKLGVGHVTLSEEMSMPSKASAILRGAASGRTGLLMVVPRIVHRMIRFQE